MSGEGYRILLRCRSWSECLRGKGFTWDQIADVLALTHPVSPLRLYRLAHGRTAAEVVAVVNDADPAGTASLRVARLYDFEAWPDAGRRPPAHLLLTLARIYQTAARNLVTGEVLASYGLADRELLDGGDFRHLDPNRFVTAGRSTGPEASARDEPALAAPDMSACVDLLRVIGAEEACVKRRELLFELAIMLGGAPAVALLRRLDNEDVNRLASAVRPQGRVDAGAVATIETLTGQCRRLDDVWGPRKVLTVVDAQRDVVASLLGRESMPTGLRTRLIQAYAQLCQLGGYLHYDLMDYPGAEQRFRTGLDAALEIGDASLVAYIHHWLSEMASFADQPGRALDHAFAARGWAARSGSSLVRERAAFGAAWALAADKRTVHSLRELHAARSWPDRLTSTEPAYLYWITESRATEGSACFVLNALGLPDETITTVTGQLAACGPAYGREQAFGLLHHGLALMNKREIPAAAAKLAEAADVMRTHSSARLVHQLTRARRRLDPWAANTHVRNLDERLSAYGLAATV